jgi:hypothetical protein
MGDLELKYAHLSNRDAPARRANREALRNHVEEIWAERYPGFDSRQLHQKGRRVSGPSSHPGRRRSHWQN